MFPILYIECAYDQEIIEYGSHNSRYLSEHLIKCLSLDLKASAWLSACLSWCFASQLTFSRYVGMFAGFN